MTLYISIISHQHTRDIVGSLQPHTLISDDVRILVTDNVPDITLADYCREHQLAYLSNEQPLGFGSNHNRAYCYCRDHLELTADDWFLVLNPDVRITPPTIRALRHSLAQHRPALAAANLFKDDEFRVLEGSIRRYPYLWDFFASLVFKSGRTTVKRRHITEPTPVDWGSGAFLVFRGELYEKLGGFDERYYLYCEDVDICWRALKLERIRPLYLPGIKAVHAGRRDSHKSINRHMLWHIASAFRFSWVRVKTRLLGPQSLRRPPL